MDDKNDSIDIFYSDYSGKSQDIYKIFLKSESKLIYESINWQDKILIIVLFVHANLMPLYIDFLSFFLDRLSSF